MMIHQYAWFVLLSLLAINIDDNMFIHGQCLKDQSSSLLQLKQSLSFSILSSSTSKLSSWNSTRDCCNWDGVTCDGVNGHVIGLDLSEEFISDGVDNFSDLFKLKHLERLNLAYNKFSGKPIPLGLDQFYNLTHLNLSNSDITGQVPIRISRMKRLVSLDLGNCNLFGPIPPSMSKLTQLHYLDLSKNILFGPIPPFMSTHLYYLDLSFNNFTGSVPNLNLSKHLVYINFADNCLTGPISSLQWDVHLKLEELNLFSNSLNGTIPPILFTLPSLQELYLDENQFTGQLGEFYNQSSSVLESLLLSNNGLEGTIPLSLFGLSSLKKLKLSFNNFNGTLELSMFQKLRNLSWLNLSSNKLWIISNGINSSLFPQMMLLGLASCNLTEFPRFLSNQSSLQYLDLSNNQIHGRIPNWLWKIGNRPTVQWRYIGLHSNLLQGPLPVDIGSYLKIALFFSLSNNFLKGEIPISICEATFLQVLDLSSNGLRGSIPQCLSSNLELRLLKLRNNSLHGIIPEPFHKDCRLRTLDLNGNKVKGEISKSLSNCRMLEIIDLGNNQITGTFPMWLGEFTNLRVLILRSNKFYGHIGHLESNSTSNMFQIIDLSSNKFTGSLPAELFLKWKGMTTNNYNQQTVRFEFLGRYYQDVVKVVNKRIEMELVKILTTFTSIDLSNNRFEGEIPQVIGDLTQLYVLNLSHNVLTGSIPSSLGNLKRLESLDLSDNKLSGGIPKQLADLIFLEVLDLSYNQLVGRIPQGPQFQTFNSVSFEQNNGLCGPPLSKTCRDDAKEVPSTTPDEDLCKFSLFKDCTYGDTINWQLISLTMGLVWV